MGDGGPCLEDGQQKSVGSDDSGGHVWRQELRRWALQTATGAFVATVAAAVVAAAVAAPLRQLLRNSEVQLIEDQLYRSAVRQLWQQQVPARAHAFIQQRRH